MVSHLSLPRGRAGWRILLLLLLLFFLFFFVCTQDISKGVVSQSLGLKRRTVVNRASWDCFPPPLLPAGSSRLPMSTPPAHLWNPLQVVTRRAVTSLKPGSCVPPARGGIRWVLRCTPRPCRHKPGRHRPRAGSLCSTSLPLHVYIGGPVGPAGTVSRSLLKLALPSPPRWLLRTIRLGYAIQFAQRSPRFKGIQFNKSDRCPCLACGNRSPAGEGCDRAGPSSWYEVRVCQLLLHCAQEKQRVTTNLGSGSFDPCASQAAIQDVEAETYFRVRPSPRSVCSDRSEGYAHSCLNPPAVGHSCNSHSRVGYVSTSSCLSGTSASWVFGSIGERANSC